MHFSINGLMRRNRPRVSRSPQVWPGNEINVSGRLPPGNVSAVNTELGDAESPSHIGLHASIGGDIIWRTSTVGARI